MTDNHILVANPPRVPHRPSVAPGTLLRVDPEPLQDELLSGDSDIDQGIAFDSCLNEYSIGSTGEHEQGRLKVASAGPVARVVRITGVEKRREDKGNLQGASQTQATQQGPAVGERRRMNEVEGKVPM